MCCDVRLHEGGAAIPVAYTLGHPLHGCLQRIERARQLVAAVTDAIRSWQASPPRALAVSQDFDREPGFCWLYVSFVPTLPAEWTHWVGDAVHNYRSALDLLVHELAFIDSGEERPGTAFPVVPSDHWTDPDVQARVRGLTREHRRMIAELQPSKTLRPDAEPEPLLLLDRLATESRHRALHPVVTLAQAVDLDIDDRGESCSVVGAVERTVPRPRSPLQVGMDLARFGVEITGPQPRVGVRARFRLLVTFSDGVVITDALAAIGEAVERAVETFFLEFETEEARRARGIERVPRVQPDDPASGDTFAWQLAVKEGDRSWPDSVQQWPGRGR